LYRFQHFPDYFKPGFRVQHQRIDGVPVFRIADFLRQPVGQLRGVAVQQM
jgi:hypothetical protein